MTSEPTHIAIDPEQLRAVQYCVAETIRHRMLTGAPIPAWMHSLHQRLHALPRMSVDGPKTAVPHEYSDTTIDTDEASRILGWSTRHVRRRASDLDGIRIAGRWIFQRRNVLEYAEEKGQRI